MIIIYLVAALVGGSVSCVSLGRMENHRPFSMPLCGTWLHSWPQA